MGDTTEIKIVESIKAHVYMICGEQVMLPPFFFACDLGML